MPGAVEEEPTVGDVVELRKPHPCGERRWRVVREGADMGLACLGCGRRILLPRHELRRRLRAVVRDAAAPGPASAAGPRPPHGAG